MTNDAFNAARLNSSVQHACDQTNEELKSAETEVVLPPSNNNENNLQPIEMSIEIGNEIYM